MGLGSSFHLELGEETVASIGIGPGPKVVRFREATVRTGMNMAILDLADGPGGGDLVVCRYCHVPHGSQGAVVGQSKHLNTPFAIPLVAHDEGRGLPELP